MIPDSEHPRDKPENDAADSPEDASPASRPDTARKRLETLSPKTGIWIVAGTISFVYCFVIAVPWRPWIYSEATLDVSWALVLHAAFARGLRHGHDVLFTFGPYGFLYTRAYTPETYGWSLASWSVFALALWAGTWRIACRVLAEPISAFFWTMLLLAIAATTAETMLFLLAILTLLVFFTGDTSRGPSPVGLFLCAVLAWAGLMKFTHFVLGVAIVGLVTAFEFPRGRRGVLPAVVYLLSLFGLWLLAGQSLGDLPGYVRWSAAIAGGYSDAMSIVGPREDIIWYLVLSAGVLAVLGFAEWRARRRSGLGLFLGIGMIFFVAFKAGFVRHDSHAMLAILVMLAMAVALVPEFVTRLGVKAGAAAAAVCAAVTVFAWTGVRHYDGRALPSYLFATVKSAPATALAIPYILSGEASYAAAYAAGMNRIRTANPLPASDGTVDIYSYSQAAVLAGNLNYSPRPVIQGYSAYTPELAEINAAFLRGDRAPDRIFLDVQTVDSRFPALDDGASWPELLTRYDIRDLTPQFLVLDRAPVARSHQLIPIKTVRGRIGKPVDVPVPDGGPIWVRIDVRPTPLGRFVDIAYKRPQLHVDVGLADGRSLRFRLVASMARAGFLLSPVIADRGAFASLASRDWPAELKNWMVRSITIVPNPSFYSAYADDVDVSFSRLEFPAQDFPDVPALVKPPLLRQLAAHVEQAPIPVELKPGPDGGWILFAHAPSKMAAPVADARTSLTVEFGMLDGSWRDNGETDGVEFRISSRSGGQMKTLWSRRLDPRLNPNDRGRQSATIDLGGTPVSELVFETLGGADTTWDWSYWAAGR